MSTLSCPRCDKDLNKQADGKFACPACKVGFPVLLDASSGGPGVPFLWPEPGAALLDWRNRYNMALADLEQQLDACGKVPADSPATTRTRLQLLHTGLQRHQQELNSLLQPLHVGEAIARETHLALRTRLPSHHGVLTYAQNIHRDWAWGEQENRIVLEHLQGALASVPTRPAKVLVLGCGAGRLACDLHQSLEADTTWALDSNPLLCLIGERMARGGTAELTEFPLTPVRQADTAIARTLRAPAAVSGLNFVCADALQPPFPPGSFDLVVTPWLLDVIDAGVTDVLRVIARMLRHGGIWLYHGSVAFPGTAPLNRLGAEELADIGTQFGFEAVHTENAEIPYLQSPANRQRRSEVVYTQVARWQGAELGDAQERHQHLPEWLVNARQPVPLTPAFQAQITTTRIHAFIMSLIDGKRSIKDMAQVLEEQRLMPAAEAAQAIRQFLTTMQEEATRSQGQGG